MTVRLTWGILGTGKIARKFAQGIRKSQAGEFLAVGSRAEGTARKFADEFGVPHAHGSYEALLADRDVQAVYIATPHPWHAAWSIRALEAGKHVLCEKPLAMNEAQARPVIEAARRRGRFLMEGLMYRCHPQTAKLLELVRGGAIGAVRVIEAAFSFRGPDDPAHRVLNRQLGGGGILDVGGYPVSLARLVAGAAHGQDFEEPIDVSAYGRLGERTGVDEYTVGILEFPGDIFAQVAAGVLLTRPNTAHIYGSEGHIFIPEPWQPGRSGGPIRLVVKRDDKPQSEEFIIEGSGDLHALEIDTVAAHADRGQALPPAMTWDDTLGNLRAMDAWRRAIGLKYDVD